MALPLLSYPPSSQNQRVIGYEIPGDEQPRIYNTENLLSPLEMDTLIRAAYRQVFNEQQVLASNRQIGLESQLRNGQITVKDFIRGLATSETFITRNFEVNNNYRLVEMCIQRLLGRPVYNDQEKLAWSTVIATEGLPGFVDQLLNSEEYQLNFDDHIVPYQRRRILPQRSQGELPCARMPRYGEDYRQQLEALGYFQDRSFFKYRWEWQKPPYSLVYRIIAQGSAVLIAVFLVSLILAIALGAWGIIPL